MCRHAGYLTLVDLATGKREDGWSADQLSIGSQLSGSGSARGSGEPTEGFSESTLRSGSILRWPETIATTTTTSSSTTTTTQQGERIFQIDCGELSKQGVLKGHSSSTGYVFKQVEGEIKRERQGTEPWVRDGIVRGEDGSELQWRGRRAHFWWRGGTPTARGTTSIIF